MIALNTFQWSLLACLVFCLLATPAHAFGAGNIASISAVEGQNWRHGDIEDVLKTVVCLKGHKWTSMMIKRVYFGNWLRDYSQAVDVGTLKGANKDVIRLLLWILGFMSFGYATAEFEVTEERLGVYRPEEHIDNPKDYADNADARKFDPRLRGPVSREELAIDPDSGMKNYIANERGGWATSSGYVKHSFTRSIHFGRVFTSGASGTRGREADLCEALRCLGQGLHCMEDFGAHSNYTELALRELGLRDVFPHVGVSTMMNLRGHQVFPLVTGTFGGVDFIHSLLGEVTDHTIQSTADEQQTAQASSELGFLTNALKDSQSTGSARSLSSFTDVLSQVPGTGELVREAEGLQRDASEQASRNDHYGGAPPAYSAPSSGNDWNYPEKQSHAYTPASSSTPASTSTSTAGGPASALQNIDVNATIKKIYPILAFRDKVMRAVDSIVSKIPGLESLIDKISETVTLFIMSLLAPYVTPIVEAASKQLKSGSTAVVDSNGKHQYEVWEDPHSTDPTHSLLSKDHFVNILNEPAGQIAAEIVRYVAPRIIYAWENPDVPVNEVLNDVIRVFHHPAIRDHRNEVHQKMFSVVERWMRNQPSGGQDLNRTLSSESVKHGRNLKSRQTAQGQVFGNQNFGGAAGMSNLSSYMGGGHSGGGSSGGPASLVSGISNLLSGSSGTHGGSGLGNMMSSFGRRDLDEPGFAARDPADEYGRGQESSYQGGPLSSNYEQHQHNQYGSQYSGGQVGYDAYAEPGRQSYGQSGYEGQGYDRQQRTEGYGRQDEYGQQQQQYGQGESRYGEESSQWGSGWGSGRNY